MSCLAIERLAAAASGEDADAVAHAATCARCGALLAEQDDVVAAARSLPAPALAHRDELLAEVLARLDWRSAAAVEDEPRRRWPYALAGVLAVAAAIALVLFATRPGSPPLALAPVAAPPVVEPAVVTSRPPPPPIAPKPVVVRKPVRRVAPKPVAIVEAPLPPPVESPPPVEAPQPPVANEAMVAFRTGWAALRNGRNAEAIAAFDRATDPAILEDAMYWAAIATDRSGDHANAKLRLRAFLDQFPQSPHAETARAALEPR